MASLKALKIRINSVKSTQKITKAMKMVAAAKLRRAQESAQNGRPYAERLEAVMAGMAARVGGVGASPLLAGTGKDDVQLLVVATSERGLAGAFNTNIVRARAPQGRRADAQGKTVKFYLAGKKGRVLKRFFPNAILADHDMSAIKAPKFDDAREIADDLIARFERGEFDVAHLFYSKFVSALVQDPVSQQLIPVPMHRAQQGRNLGRGGRRVRAERRGYPRRAAAAQRRRADLPRAAGKPGRFLRFADECDGQCHAQCGRHDPPPVDPV